MIPVEAAKLAYLPPLPQDADGLGIPSGLVTDLMLRRVYVDGNSKLSSLRRSLKLPLSVLETHFRHLMHEKLVEVRGMAGPDYVFGLTTQGRQLAADRMGACRYVGPAPVGLALYQDTVRAQASRISLTREQLRNAYSDMVLSDRFIDQLGPALMSQTTLFLFGPTGNGKTSIAERVNRIYDDLVLIPYAVEVDGQIIVVYDPVVHYTVDLFVENLDPRFAICRRPAVITGGEMTGKMLELRPDPISNIYSAPLQMKANNGILVIDDFGRQSISPVDLLNRWIIPLDRRVDYLELNYGVKFQIPFELMVVFATNLDPKSLADEAFLRRVPNKIYVGPINRIAFAEIFRRVTRAKRIEAGEDAADQLADLCLVKAGAPHLRACLANDVCDIMIRINSYEGRPQVATPDVMERAVALYFAELATQASD